MNRKYWIGSMLFVLLLGLLSACSSEPTNKIDNNNQTLNSDGTINWEERIEANKALGKITYMTGYYYAASPPDIQVVLAEKLGYFDELGLDIEILPGLDADGMKFLATNNVQIASAGTPSIVLQAISNGAPIEGIATFGHVGTSALMVRADANISEPAHLVGKLIGYHGALPANMLAMFSKNGVDMNDIKSVNLGYDYTPFINGDIDALTIYKSNEPYLMEKLGIDIAIVDPGLFGAETSFGVLAANADFASENKEAVEDFLRAVAKSHDYVVANPAAAVDVLASLSETVYDVAAELNRWTVEMGLLQEAKVDNNIIGYQTAEQWQREIDILLDAKVIKESLDVTKVMTNRYLDGIKNLSTFDWPETTP